MPFTSFLSYRNESNSVWKRGEGQRGIHRINPKMEQFWNWNDCEVFRICQFVETLVAAAVIVAFAIALIRICSFQFDFTFDSTALMPSCEYKLQLIAKSIDFIPISYGKIRQVIFDANPISLFFSFSVVCFSFGNVLLFIQIWKRIDVKSNQSANSIFLSTSNYTIIDWHS